MKRTYQPSVLITAIIFDVVFCIFFLGGAYFLCAYKDWSLWTIFFAVMICMSETATLFKILGIKDEE